MSSTNHPYSTLLSIVNSSLPFYSLSLIYSLFFFFPPTGFKTDRYFWRACNQKHFQVRGDLSEIRSGMGLMVTLRTCTHPSHHCDGWPSGESIQCIVISHFLKGANYARLPCVLIVAFSPAPSRCGCPRHSLSFSEQSQPSCLLCQGGKRCFWILCWGHLYLPTVTSETPIPRSGSLNTTLSRL